MNTLAKRRGRPPKSPEPETNGLALSGIAKLENDFQSQCEPLLPDEMADPDSARVLKIAFLAGIRIAAATIQASSVAPYLSTSQTMLKTAVDEKKAADGILAPPAP